MFKTQSYHQSTSHSYKSVRMGGGFLDWSTQPSAFKSYPHFYPRFELDETRELDALILCSAKITFEKKYGKDSYFLRVQPSAGALYPTELYVQIRLVKGWIDGVYHFEPQTNKLALLYQLNGDGIESAAGLDFSVNGVLFLIASPYFRSSWKYKNRAFRYCLLDTGHLFGAIEASAYVSGFCAEAIFSFDKLELSSFMGFENKELATLLVSCGEKIERIPKKPLEKIPFVNATDYFEPNEIIEKAYLETNKQNAPSIKPQTPEYKIDKKGLKEAILTRRSIRAFYGHGISETELDFILEFAAKPINSQNGEQLKLYVVANKTDGLENGVYLDQKPLKKGDFREEAGYLCLEQALGRDSGATIFITANPDSYQCAVITAGLVGHRIYLAAATLGIGVSGIGAYYDDEVKKFLGSDESVLYAIAIGR